MVVNYKYITLLITLLITSCKQKDVKNIQNNDLDNYFVNSLNYELQHNALSLDGNIIKSIFLNDSANLIELYNDNFKVNNNTILRVVSIPRGIHTGLLFYKYMHYEMQYPAHNLLHVEYPLDENGRKKIQIFEISDYDLPKAAYIIWSSKPINFNGSIIARDSKSIYTWGINKSTDTIISNLKFNTIKSIYKDFEGVYIFKKYKSITFNYKYPTDNGSFFEHIELKE